MAAVDVIPLFLETIPDLQIDDKDLLISSRGQTGSTVCIQHIPTGLRVESSGPFYESLLLKTLLSLNHINLSYLSIHALLLLFHV